MATLRRRGHAEMYRKRRENPRGVVVARGGQGVALRAPRHRRVTKTHFTRPHPSPPSRPSSPRRRL